MGEIIEIKNFKLAILINNKEDERKGILEIIDINNIQNNYTLNENKYIYVLSNNWIINRFYLSFFINIGYLFSIL